MSAPVRRVLLFAGLFMLVYLTLQLSGASAPWVERIIVPSAVQLINALQLTPTPASAAGTTIAVTGGGLNVLEGCEGLDMISLWIAAVGAGSLSWRGRLLGWTLGTVAVLAFNQIRLANLLWIWREQRSWFDAAHGLWWPIGLVLMVWLLFMAWSAWFESARPLEQAPAHV